MEENKQCDARLTSPAAFVEGGIQDACDDACSICLEPFSDSDPSTVTSFDFHVRFFRVVILRDLGNFSLLLQLTSCRHEFHLQCVLECQELLEAVEQERSASVNPSRNTTIFHHPALGDFELQGLPVGATDAELEERIIQHLAAAAAMGRARHIGRRESQRNRSSAQARPQFFVFSTHPNTSTADPVSSSPTQREGEPTPTVTVPTPSSPAAAGEESPEQSTQLLSASASGSSALASSQHESTLNNRRSPNQPSPNSQDRAGPSDFQSFSESLKSRFNAVSMRYKESISKSTRGWKERFFSRYNTTSDLGSEVRREDDAGIKRVSGMMERLETRDNNSSSTASVSNSPNNSVPESNNQQVSETAHNNPMNDTNAQGSCGASSGTN
ncbi:RING-type domain-containing protein [Citrus sinensis]|uniref:RING-type domain-containing protein n=1 Tax=Citrus sinensis TaxID=2711 RepID=A0ACB8NEE7_CITSI|nr:RING-type domain-containing protein [Citrus sinensis]